MGEMFVYILKSSLCLTAFYLFFKLILSRDTLFRFNRIILLLLFVLSLIIPFIVVSFHKETSYSGLGLNLEALLAMAQTEDVPAGNGSSHEKWLMVLFIVYMIGVAVSVIQTSISFVRMSILIRSGKNRKINPRDRIVLVIHNKEVAPFSWMRYIILSEKDYSESGKEIVAHEEAHIKNHHSMDLLLAEVVRIIHWFNPAAYLLKQELQNIHEFQADQAVINNGIDAKQYQLLLIKKAVGPRLYTMANSFNHSKLKIRITMISKKKSNRAAALKAIFVLPLTALAIVAFASEEVSSKLEVISNTKITEIFPQDTIKKHVKTVLVSNMGDENGNIELKQHITITVKSTDSSLLTGENLNSETMIVNLQSDPGSDSVKTLVSIDRGEKDRPLVIINGKEIDWDLFKALNPESIESVTVLKDKVKTQKYGKRGENGVILISLKSDNKVTVKIASSSNKHTSKSIIIGAKKGEDQPLYVVDGVVKEKAAMESVKPDKIEYVSILKGEAAVRLYGEKGKNGVIVITLKK